MQDRASHSAKASWCDLLLWLRFPAALMSVPHAGAVSTLEQPGRRGRTPGARADAGVRARPGQPRPVTMS